MDVVCLEAGHLLVVLGIDIGENRIFALQHGSAVPRVIDSACDTVKTYRRDLLWQVNFLLQGHLALLQRTMKIDVLDLLAEIGSLLDQSDKTPFHNQAHVGALLNLLQQSTASIDGKSLTPIGR